MQINWESFSSGWKNRENERISFSENPYLRHPSVSNNWQKCSILWVSSCCRKVQGAEWLSLFHQCSILASLAFWKLELRYFPPIANYLIRSDCVEIWYPEKKGKVFYLMRLVYDMYIFSISKMKWSFRIFLLKNFNLDVHFLTTLCISIHKIQ